MSLDTIMTQKGPFIELMKNGILIIESGHWVNYDDQLSEQPSIAFNPLKPASCALRSLATYKYNYLLYSSQWNEKKFYFSQFFCFSRTKKK